jgi:hypothetical protein
MCAAARSGWPAGGPGRTGGAGAARGRCRDSRSGTPDTAAPYSASPWNTALARAATTRRDTCLVMRATLRRAPRTALQAGSSHAPRVYTVERRMPMGRNDGTAHQNWLSRLSKAVPAIRNVTCVFQKLTRTVNAGIG